ncbi:ABC transporter substrate-binding protein [Gordoniibacillus kamchatkensis]|uniref:ABC transporter substrate-binding protein n=1 Tax=Gordoniibacillus kamchatkensis TaxID=1590651 RepID=UPI0006982210|nr:ABC transporter substrate-binding protein [Paenibacillus sp. VKM B-2647]
MQRTIVLKGSCVVLTSLLALTACSIPASKDSPAPKAASKDNSTSATDAKSGEVTEITFWHNWSTGPSGDSITKSVEAFNKSHPNIKVKPVYVATDGGDSVTSKLLTAVAGGNPPDVMLASRYGVAEYMDAVTILNDRAKQANIGESMFYKWAWDESVYDGKLLGLPYDGTARALFYNKDHFKEAGLDPEKPPTTIAELEDAAKKLTKKEGGKFTRFGLIPWYGEGWLYSWGWAFGGSFLDAKTGKVTANDPNIVKALEWETGFAKQFGIQDVTSFTSSAGSNATNPFITGQLSMMVNGNWMISQIEQYNPKLNYGISYIPTPTGKDFNTFVGGRVLIMPKGAKHPDAAWEFIKWMCTSEEGQSLKKLPANSPPPPPSIRRCTRTTAGRISFWKCSRTAGTALSFWRAT